MNPHAFAWMIGSPRAIWTQRGELARNWLALGMLLAAWNAVDGNEPAGIAKRPHALRGYACISVRAVQRSHLPSS